MFDQRILGAKDLSKPAQWHRIAVHNEPLGAYAVQQLVKKYGSFFWENWVKHLMSLSNAGRFNAALLFMLRVTLKREYTMTASMVKLKISQRYVFVKMVCYTLCNFFPLSVVF